MSENTVKNEAMNSVTNRGLGKRLDAASWGLFFIWVGVALLADLGWGLGLVGVAAIIFLKQTARRYFGRRLESFWVAVGVLFLLGGTWELYQIQISLVPILLIAVGGALLLRLFGRRSHVGWDWCHRSRPRDAYRWHCCSGASDER
jgi:uncharacterized membrane protein